MKEKTKIGIEGIRFFSDHRQEKYNKIRCKHILSYLNLTFESSQNFLSYNPEHNQVRLYINARCHSQAFSKGIK